MTRVKATVAMNIITILLFRQLFESCDKKKKKLGGEADERRTQTSSHETNKKEKKGRNGQII